MGVILEACCCLYVTILTVTKTGRIRRLGHVMRIPGSCSLERCSSATRTTRGIKKHTAAVNGGIQLRVEIRGNKKRNEYRQMAGMVAPTNIQCTTITLKTMVPVRRKSL
ncbi:uncharacterized protein LOC118512652 [Anopheles stephensi]|uniref:uncharacterized protein LOC118512652 n=1 Tax=Anopheles stephensi TaxID=30069 RepID=UPI0016589406|nr:uncharacterized protein LOC118512652 [Anopheles stephensi]